MSFQLWNDIFLIIMIKSTHFNKDDITALEAISQAQRIAFAPMLFQATLCLRDFGILAYLDKVGRIGASLDDICQNIELNQYAIHLLLDMGLTSHIIYQNQQNYCLGKIGFFILHDQMTRVNMDFTQDVCYQGLFSLKESLQQMKPVGLKVFGDWPTIYPALSQLPEPAKQSWFNFDHFYSSAAFDAALKVILGYKPKTVYDLGGNTGKWALACCEADPDINVTILDLPQQIALMQENIKQSPYRQRISGAPIDILTDTPLPKQADLWWMSQFLDCFTKTQIIEILQKIHRAMKDDAKVAIMEVFWDCQAHEAGAFSLNASSLYFTCMANGNSRFYSIDDFEQILQQTGFVIERTEHQLGVGHTILVCSKAK